MGTVFDRFATLSVEGSLAIGARCYFGTGVVIACFEAVTIGDDVRFGERVSVHDENHRFEPVGQPGHEYDTAKVEIGDRVWLGAGVVVLPGVSIGADSVVGAGSVVSKSLPSGVLAAGVPAKVLRWLEPVGAA
ncbi:MAG: acyltransferase [Beijerinckiaceae bacterium]|nr:acyltransferase [Beijerinckiaceae bacterium]